jgi:hypothetical protein
MALNMDSPRQWQTADSNEYLFADSATAGIGKYQGATSPVITMEVKPPADAPMQASVYVIFQMNTEDARQFIGALSQVVAMLESGHIPDDAPDC